MSIEFVKHKYEEQLMRLPNVMGVAVGEKNGKAVIVVFVKQKVPVTSLRPQEIVPEKLEGYGTNVQEIGHVTAQIK